MSSQLPPATDLRPPAQARVAVVASRFNPQIVEQLLAGCLHRLQQMGLPAHQTSVYRVPGAFELPVTAAAAAKSGRFAAVICLGCVVRGDTPHFDYVAGEAARGIQQVAVESALPVIFGVLTTNTQQQALDRLDRNGPHGHAGERAAEAAVEMMNVMEKVRENAEGGMQNAE